MDIFAEMDHLLCAVNKADHRKADQVKALSGLCPSMTIGMCTYVSAYIKSPVEGMEL